MYICWKIVSILQRLQILLCKKKLNILKLQKSIVFQRKEVINLYWICYTKLKEIFIIVVNFHRKVPDQEQDKMDLRENRDFLG